MSLYKRGDYLRQARIDRGERRRRPSEHRSPFRRDYARLLHCPSFRRLQGKTQLFPLGESDFFRTRLTHSLEVAQVAKAIATLLNRTGSLTRLGWAIDTDLVEFSGLAHDIGHPPFGHSGEDVLNNLMHGKGGFEGNAQSLRIVARLEKRLDDPERQTDPATGRPIWFQQGQETSAGLNLCFRSLASILKYDACIPEAPGGRPLLSKGYYKSEQALVDRIRIAVASSGHAQQPLKTIECAIMDHADDIAYSTYDLEDAFRAGLLDPLSIVAFTESEKGPIAQELSLQLAERVTEADVARASRQVLSMCFPPTKKSQRRDSIREAIQTYSNSRAYAEVGHWRTMLTSHLIDRAVGATRIVPNRSAPEQSQLKIDEEHLLQIGVLKRVVFRRLIRSDRLKMQSARARTVITGLFETLLGEGGADLLPTDWRQRYEEAATDSIARQRVVCDFIAGMTDRQALETFAIARAAGTRSIFQLF